jgi:hypothetical protein
MRLAHLVSALTAAIGSVVVVVAIGVWFAFAIVLRRLPPDACAWCFFAGIAGLIAAKIACRLDRGRLVGTKPIDTSLLGDFVAICGIGSMYVDPYNNRFGALASMGFFFATAVFAFYWSEAAGSMRLAPQKTLLHRAMIGMLVTLGIGLLFVLEISTPDHVRGPNPDATNRLIVQALGLSALGAFLVALLHWFWGLAGVIRTLQRGDAKLPKSSVE